MIDSIEQKVKTLPPDIYQEVEHYIDFLISKYTPVKKQLQLNWKGSLKDENEKTSSVELQHKALDWWGE